MAILLIVVATAALGSVVWQTTISSVLVGVNKEGVVMAKILVVFLLLFPALDMIATHSFARSMGISMWWIVAIGALIGVVLIRRERHYFRSRFMSALNAAASRDPHPWRNVINSGRKVLSGVLLLMPGVLSDVMAMAILLVPINAAARLVPSWAMSTTRGRATQSPIETTYRRVD
jgi:UPF0716 protein FxsA